MLDIVLYQPEIPPNTGNIIRLCANTGFQLHLIRPFGFVMDDKKLRRAGLDYHELANVEMHDSLDDYLAARQPNRVMAITTKGRTGHTAVEYQSGDALIFGPESRGLPIEFIESLPENQRLRIPMLKDSRSLNLSNSAAIMIYEAWRQLDFEGAEAL
ncbi:tRNA (uridine(34)/cytosine(34)/5-carboxymethylaminomethyluridine(34)-2'-O)-methyltransferase TrmL [Litoribrevibacter euphylliae]|uniref:tRNA (cytidine(34)-2'-O)-methyltransferase n=1 Tax=Litoribrevibacter euphylliae TaxID=1834034 RepID=A0ABV7HER1_9GAMM